MLPAIRTRWSQDPFELMSRELDRVFSRYQQDTGTTVLAPYAVDVHEDSDHYHVEAELPGFSKDDVSITLENGVVTISAQRQDHTGQHGHPKGTPLHVERRWTQFQRSFTLPTAVDENQVTATLNDGVLSVTLNKREETKPRRIQITASNGRSEKAVTAGSSTAQNASQPEASQKK